MVLYHNHYFIEERTPFSSYYIEHFTELDESCSNKRKSGKRMRKAEPDHCIKSADLVRSLMRGGFFREINYGEFSVMNTTFYNEVRDNLNYGLEYDEKYCTQLIAPSRKVQQKIKLVYGYADFEADTTGKQHTPYLCVYHSQDGSVQKEFHGTGCARDLLHYLATETTADTQHTVYFHNLAYDIRMMAEHGLCKSIIKGTKTMTADITYEGKLIHFKDTLPILQCKLSALPAMFNLEAGQKEIFPYKYYTIERYNENRGDLRHCGDNEDKPWGDKEYEQFIKNVDSIEGCRIDENTFDMRKYAAFYCHQDVRILREGFESFCKGFVKDFGINPKQFISASSLANEVFNKNVYYPNGNLYKVGGHVRHFLSRAVYGGRCMCAYNKKWHVKKNISDFDAVSLYPSAMARLYTVEGRPKVIPEDKLNYSFLSKQSAYVVEIRVTKVHKHYPFPLIVQKQNGLNLNDDNLDESAPATMVVDNIALEDLITFQKIEYELIRGYYWDGKRDYKIQEIIKHLFNKRLEYKAEHNPLQQLYKLIMNSCYGKTIERPVEKDYKYFDSKESYEKYFAKNYYKIAESFMIGDHIHAVRTVKPIDKHFNFSLLGIQVLSMSKRIMNEVMCLAYDIGCHIYYQDTDSMHIEVDDLPKLVDAYKNTYNRDLIGKQMGQFHSDFTSMNGREDVKYAVESIFLMKKMYIDKLLLSDDTIDYMIRGKGITTESIKAVAHRQFNGDYMALYEHLYQGNEVTFDLTDGKPAFAMNKNMTVSTLNEFKRRIKTVYSEGESL